MPISKKTGKPYYTQEQVAIARQNANALEYALSHGYQLVRKGQYYSMPDHDSMVFTSDGKWFWNSRRLHGDAIDFMVHYEGKSLPEAVLELSGDYTPTQDRVPTLPPRVTEPQQPVPFILPLRSPTMIQTFGYLCGARKIDRRIVSEMIRQKVLYESTYKPKNSDKEIHNACFVSYKNGVPCCAFQRGLSQQSTYKGEVPGGDKSTGWILHGKDPKNLYVFEAAIDAASFVSFRLATDPDHDPLTGADYLALGGLQYDPIRNYLDARPDVNIALCLDSDEWGQRAAADFAARLQEAGHKATIIVPPTGKDWNDTLITYIRENRNEYKEEKTK